MKLATQLFHGQAVPVLIADGAAHDLRAAFAASAFVRSRGLVAEQLTLLALIEGGSAALEALREVEADRALLARTRLPAGEATPLAPIPRPPKNVFCLGRNYAEHIREDNVSREQQTELPKYPQFFTKPHTAIVGDGADIRYDERVTRRLDYEVELAVVIGIGGRDIPVEDAMNHVFGYTVANDITARDLQRRHDQWFKGKGLDTSCPMGPWIVTADEIADPHALRISLSVNGQPRQNASTGDMIFRIPETIASLSAGLTLEPGDLIATGTPSGVGYAMDPRCFLADGDLIECEVEGVGVLRNTVRKVG